MFKSSLFFSRHLGNYYTLYSFASYVFNFLTFKACRNFQLDDKCVEVCPRCEKTIWDPKENQEKNNTDIRYTYANLCVESCPGKKHFV